MSDDASYTAFLNKANESPSASASLSQTKGAPSTSQAKSKFDPTTTQQSSAAVPASLQNISATYISDTDSPFEPVSFDFSGDQLPDARGFAGLAGASGREVEELSVEEWDPRGEYGDVVDKVKSAGGGKGKGKGTVKVFRAAVSQTRVEYYIVTLGDRKVVGVVTKAVES